jgi:hypothetical protein
MYGGTHKFETSWDYLEKHSSSADLSIPKSAIHLDSTVFMGLKYHLDVAFEVHHFDFDQISHVHLINTSILDVVMQFPMNVEHDVAQVKEVYDVVIAHIVAPGIRHLSADSQAIRYHALVQQAQGVIVGSHLGNLVFVDDKISSSLSVIFCK